MTVSGTQVATHRAYKFSADQLPVFNRSQAQLQVNFFGIVKFLGLKDNMQVQLWQVAALAPCKRTQHCWMLHVASVYTH